MFEDGSFFEMLKYIVKWTCPLVFVLGIVLILYSNYRQLEDKLGLEIGGIKKRVVPMIETNIYVFHSWLTERKTVLGLICIVFSMAAFFMIK